MVEINLHLLDTNKISFTLPKKNLAPNRCTQSGNQKLVGMHASPMIKVCRNTESSIGSPQNGSTSVILADTTTEDTSHTDAVLPG